MLGHDVTVFVLDDPAAKYDGTLDRLDEKGAVVVPTTYGQSEPVFIPMHRIKYGIAATVAWDRMRDAHLSPNTEGRTE